MSLKTDPALVARFILILWFLFLIQFLGINTGVVYAQVEGSCKDAGHLTCCAGSFCQGASDDPISCFCDRDCYKFDSCCKDINETCPQGPCVASGYSDSCCVEDNCKTSAGCFCDELCYRFQDCCYDINSTACTESTFRGDTYLLFANQYAIRRINLDGSSLQTVVTGEEGAAIVGMDFHYRLTNMYWSDNGSNSIMKANLNGSQVSTVISKGLGRVVGLAVDWFTNKLYLTDELHARIDVFDVERSLRKNLIFTGANSTVRGIAVDPSTRWMYWTDCGTPAKIEKASMDGSNRTVLHDTDLVWPNGITLDYEAQVVYWIDAFNDVLEFSNVNGTNRRVLQTEDLGQPFGLTLYDKLLYWTDWSELAILSTRKAVGDTVGRIVANLTYPPMSIQVVSPDRQRQGENPCSVDNGGCSDLCLLSINSNGYSCDCLEGSVLLDNQKDCMGSCQFGDHSIGQDCLGFPSSHVAPTPTHSVAVSGTLVSPIIPSIVVTESSSASMHDIPVSLTPTTVAVEPANTPTTPSPVVPGPVTQLTLQSINSSSGFMITWVPPSAMLIKYQITVTSHVSGVVFDEVIPDPTLTSFNVPSLEPFVPYTVTVRAATSFGYGPSVSKVGFTEEGVPSVGPSGLSVVRMDQSMTATWDALSLVDARGFIIGYSLTYVSVEEHPSSAQLVVKGNVTTATVERLSPDLSYSVMVSGITVAGTGPSSDVSVIVEAIVTSSLFQLQMIGVDKCKDWKETDEAVKLENVTAAIVENVESDYCTCGFSAEDIVEASFYCFEDVETAVTFCAKLYGTVQINSSEILQFISKWVLKGNAITFGESGLMLSTDCPVEVDSCDNSGCELPFPPSSDVNTGLLIGALVLLTLLLLAAIVITATVVVRKRTSNARHLLDNKREEGMQLIERSSPVVKHTTRETGVGTEVERETDIDSGKEVLLPKAKKTSSSATQTLKEEEPPTLPSYEVHYVTPV